MGALLYTFTHLLGIVKIFSGAAVICETQELTLAAELLLFCGRRSGKKMLLVCVCARACILARARVCVFIGEKENKKQEDQLSPIFFLHILLFQVFTLHTRVPAHIHTRTQHCRADTVIQYNALASSLADSIFASVEFSK